MHREIQGPAKLLEQIRLHLQNQLEMAGFGRGPKVSAGEGWMTAYTKGVSIVSIELTTNEETQDGKLSIKCEQDVSDLSNIWDSALITYAKEFLSRLESYAINKERIKREL